MKKISIMIPCYNEEENFVPISEAVINELGKSLPEYDYEILFLLTARQFAYSVFAEEQSTAPS